ncbi:flagellar basal body-associated FliL family protein [Acidiferrimicrobium sp. IK]|uniref:flagellar basal body-associated FliL family protein n=1 Tax=Acidiferrimicrobium sp. IK TaxID=2871700 RepID=UPI0021CB7B38|nr:flagellar basal body-associated FliL family protein [Acidiferrimicrobium sp. IK]MCU4185043.1 flagellar basal body-associated FliL family protein [Acidiferrimicrobium sp. IK]
MTATTIAPAQAAGTETAPKKSKKKLIILLVVVLLAGGYVAKGILLKPHYLPGQKVPAGKILDLSQLTVNLSDGHLVQATISLQLSKVANSKAVGADLQRFEDAINTVFGSDNYATLLSPQGRDAAKAAILKDCQKITGTVDGAAQQVLDIYFVGFVIQ